MIDKEVERLIASIREKRKELAFLEAKMLDTARDIQLHDGGIDEGTREKISELIKVLSLSQGEKE